MINEHQRIEKMTILYRFYGHNRVSWLLTGPPLTQRPNRAMMSMDMMAVIARFRV